MDEPRYEVTLSGLIKLIRWCKVTPWAQVSAMLEHASSEGWLRPTTPPVRRMTRREHWQRAGD